MLKKKKKIILKNKRFLLLSKNFLIFSLKKALQKNSNISLKSRAFLFTQKIISKKSKICLFSGKTKAVHSIFKLNRHVVNSFSRFNYFPGIKSFGQ